jgi:hypothetical protein
VIMGPDEPSEEIQQLLVSPMFDSRVRYIKGSVMSAADLFRIAADEAV